MIRRVSTSLAVAGLMFPAVPAAADNTVAGAQTPVIPASVQLAPVLPAAVSAVYKEWNIKPMWFRGNTATPAAAQLVAILRRSPFEGITFGPQLAMQVEQAMQQAAGGDAAAVAAAEQALSGAWVSYVQALRQPTPGMDYAHPSLAPQGKRADQILLVAAAAPSLEAHLTAVSNVNPIYAQLRDAGMSSGTPDPRLLANLARARTIPGNGRFVVVDAGGQRMMMFENGRMVDSMKIIVGTSEFPTPMIASYIYYVTLNPYWNSPDHLVQRNIAPKVLKGGAKYFKSSGYEVMADWTENSAVIPFEQIDWKAVAAGKKQIRVRQQPGPQNFMATMKIPFQNDHDIYLHDTPAKQLFANSQRALSNGCVRLEDAPRFARWLFNGRDPVAGSTAPEQNISIPRGVPIYLTYLTAQVRDGKLSYVTDVYGWDRAGKTLAAR